MQHDDPKQLTVLSGHVQAVKGTLLMRAAHMEVQQDAQGQQVASFRANEGERVFFRQKREGVNEFVEGEAEQAVYDSRQDLMTLTGRAEVRILRQDQPADQVFGHRIVYNNSTEVLSVQMRAALSLKAMTLRICQLSNVAAAVLRGLSKFRSPSAA